MKINVYGMGYVGCVSAACLARDGHDVTGIDIDPAKVGAVNDGRSPIVEPELGELIRSAVDAGHLLATTGKAPAADMSMVCVGTPSNDNGSLGLGFLHRVVEGIGDYLKSADDYHVVNIRSTVLPGTVNDVVIPALEARSGKQAGDGFGVCMNPEFMRESTSVQDFYNPPFSMIGELDARSGDVVAAVYEQLDAPLLRSDIRVAEMIKYACNAFHALKVGFANEIGNLCKRQGIDSHAVMDVFCRDTKLNLSSYYLKPGFAFGGSCLPKDVRALTYLAKTVDLETPVLSAIMPSNEQQIERAYEMVRKSGKKKIGVLGLSFKAGTDDLRESPIVELIEKLIGKGYTVKIYDREVSLARIFGSNKRYIDQAIPHLSALMTESLEELESASEVVVIGNRSEEFNDVVANLSNGKLVIDLVRLDSRVARRAEEGYDGICW